MYKEGEKVRLKNDHIVTLQGQAHCVDGTEAYYTDKNFVVTPDMIKEKLN